MDSIQHTNILVTGGTGFLGSHLVPKLVQLGARVTCLVRESSDTSRLPDGVDTVRADLLTGRGLEEALHGQDILVHMAALLFGIDWQDYLRANVRCAQNITHVLQANPGTTPGKVIVVSSQAASGPAGPDRPLRDDCLPNPVSAYGWSKLLMERTFQSACPGDLVILRPSIIYGSGDLGLLPVFRGIRKGIAVSPGLNRAFYVSCIHADDMADAITACLTHSAQGVYHVNDGRIYTMDEVYEAIASVLQTDLHILHMPLPVMHCSAFLASAAFRCMHALLRHTFRRAPNWNMDKYREACQTGWIADASRICQELSFSPGISLRQGMQEAVEGYRSRGLLS